MHLRGHKCFIVVASSPQKIPSVFSFAGRRRKKAMISNLTGYSTAFTPEPHQATTRAITLVSPLVRRLKMHLEKCPLRWSNWCLTEIWKYITRLLYYYFIIIVLSHIPQGRVVGFWVPHKLRLNKSTGKNPCTWEDFTTVQQGPSWVCSQTKVRMFVLSFYTVANCNWVVLTVMPNFIHLVKLPVSINIFRQCYNRLSLVGDSCSLNVRFLDTKIHLSSEIKMEEEWRWAIFVRKITLSYSSRYFSNLIFSHLLDMPFVSSNTVDLAVTKRSMAWDTVVAVV